MHEARNTAATLMLVTAIIWAFFVWVGAPAMQTPVPAAIFQKAASIIAVAVLGAFVIYAVSTSDRLDDQLARATSGHYFERDGLCFMPLTRVVQSPDGPQAEISLFYQSRYDGLCEAVVRIGSLDGALLGPNGSPAIHFAFRCDPGAFGVIHLPIGVAPGRQGTLIEADLAAAVRWPGGHGDQLRSREGRPCGRLRVDWTRVYDRAPGDADSEIELKKAVRFHLTLPENVRETVAHGETLNETITGL